MYTVGSLFSGIGGLDLNRNERIAGGVDVFN